MKPLKRKKKIFFCQNKTSVFLPNIGIDEATKKQVAEPNIVLRKIVKK